MTKKDKILQMLAAGSTVSNIVENVGVSRAYVSQVAKQNGVALSSPGRKQSMPTGDNPMAEFIRDYYNKYGSFLSIDDIQAELRVNCRRTIELWRDGGKMSGPVLIALEGLRKKYKL